MLIEKSGGPEAASFADFDLSGADTVIAAVSGGSDSTALLLLLREHLMRNAPRCRLVAVTIDHALRPGSEREAEAVAKLCGGLGVAHRTLVWAGPKPATGIAAAARAARYRFLDKAARLEGASIVITGHTADDQAETVTMRGQRGEGIGSAGMAPLTLIFGRTWLARPLLGCRRHFLRDELTRRGIGWIDDPTNDNQRFERPRLRATLSHSPHDFSQAISTAAEAARRRIALGEAAAALLAQRADQPSPGLIRLDPALTNPRQSAADREAAVHLLRVLLACIGGVAYLPDHERMQALLDTLATGGHGKPVRATLSRCVADRRAAGLFLLRETRSLPSPRPATTGIWDGRFRLRTDDGLAGATVAPLGADAVEPAKAYASETAPESLVRAALCAQPALRDTAGRLIEAGSDNGFEPVLAPWAGFLPGFDLTIAAKLGALLGTKPLPAVPWHEADACKA